MQCDGRSVVLIALACLSACQGEPDQLPGPPPGPVNPAPRNVPNILLILVDDLGYADLGVTGSEIRTPNIDRLAGTGVFLTDFHATPVCFATRAALMTGVDHHLAGMGSLAFARAANQRDHPGYEGQLSPQVATVAQLLLHRGYHTYMTGKWDLGDAPTSRPERRGFERSWALMEGGASHFSDASGLVLFQFGAHYRDDGHPVKPPATFYSSTFYTDQMLHYLAAQPDDGRPFFAYVAYTAPHWPLQVPDDWRARYAGVYDAGYEKLLKQRLWRMKALGLIGPDAQPHAAPPQVDAWKDLSPDQRRAESRRMELYAAMVEFLDQQVGRLLDWVNQSRFARNTLVVFLSDNGPEGNSIGKLPLNSLWIPLLFDNSAENIGKSGSYAWYGPGWAHASAAPFRLYKAYPTEGGYRVPAIVAWPGRLPAGSRDAAFLTVSDLEATLLDFGGVERPARSGTDAAVAPVHGSSFRDRLTDSSRPGPNAGRAVALELFGRRAVRRDQWKALQLARPFGTGSWELFDLDTDPGERHDLATAQPAMLAELIEAWDRYASEVGVVLPEGGESAYGLPDLPAVQ